MTTTATKRGEGVYARILLELQYLIEGLSDVYTREGVEVFWHGRQRELDDRRPVDLAEAGDFAALVALVGQLRDSNF